MWGLGAAATGLVLAFWLLPVLGASACVGPCWEARRNSPYFGPQRPPSPRLGADAIGLAFLCAVVVTAALLYVSLRRIVTLRLRR